MRGLLEVAAQQLLENPLNWVLVLFNAWLVKELVKSQPAPPPPKHPKVTMLRGFTLQELRNFNGASPDVPIYIAVNKKVYDVTKGRGFYGPGGAYGSFAGRDASRALAKNSYEETMFSDQYDQLSDLAPAEWDALREWAQFFEGRYPCIGWIEVDGERV